jgi:hypothetical protein
MMESNCDIKRKEIVNIKIEAGDESGYAGPHRGATVPKRGIV